jgi:hypothetical protein
MRRTFYLKGLWLFISILFLFSESSLASHSKGADISYEYVGQDASGNYMYRVTLSFYRDCAGASDPGGCNYNFGANCTISGSSCVAPGIVYFYMLSQSCGQCIKDQFGAGDLVSKKEVTPICPGQATTCNGGSNPGIEVWEYSKIVTLPVQCTDWRFIYGSYARNNSITTISPTSVGIYVEAGLNSVDAPTNSSPKFSVPPVPFLCVGQQFCYNHGAYEKDGDSIVYTLNAPLIDILPGILLLTGQDILQLPL